MILRTLANGNRDARSCGPGDQSGDEMMYGNCKVFVIQRRIQKTNKSLVEASVVRLSLAGRWGIIWFCSREQANAPQLCEPQGKKPERHISSQTIPLPLNEEGWAVSLSSIRDS